MQLFRHPSVNSSRVDTTVSGHGSQASTHGTVQVVGHMFFLNSRHRLEVLLSLACVMRLRAGPPSMQNTPCMGFPFFECSPLPTRMPSRIMVYATDRGVPWVTKWWSSQSGGPRVNTYTVPMCPAAQLCASGNMDSLKSSEQHAVTDNIAKAAFAHFYAWWHCYKHGTKGAWPPIGRELDLPEPKLLELCTAWPQCACNGPCPCPPLWGPPPSEAPVPIAHALWGPPGPSDGRPRGHREHPIGNIYIYMYMSISIIYILIYIYTYNIYILYIYIYTLPAAVWRWIGSWRIFWLHVYSFMFCCCHLNGFRLSVPLLMNSIFNTIFNTNIIENQILINISNILIQIGVPNNCLRLYRRPRELFFLETNMFLFSKGVF